MGTDQLLKDILRAFFDDFLALFLPAIAAEVKPGSAVFLDPEVFTDIPQGERRIADVAARVESRQGEPRLVLIHTEVQAEREEAFDRRMYRYNAMLRLRHDLPVLSIALTLYPNTKGIHLQRVTETVLGQELTLVEYFEIGVHALEAAAYLQATPILAAGMAALMKVRKRDRVKVKAALFRRLAGADIDEARLFLLLNLIETFLPLDDREVSALRGEFRKGGKAMETPMLTWADRMIEKGREEMRTWADRMVEQGREEGREAGREEGALRAERDLLLRQLRARFHTVPDALAQHIAEADRETLDQLGERVVLAATLNEVMSGL